LLTNDYLMLAVSAWRFHRLRRFLTALGIAVGIASVVLLTSIGEGLHRYVLAEFTQFGTNLIGVSPGKSITTGVSGALISNVRPLSLEDAAALRRLPRIEAVVPLVQGNAPVESGKRTRRVTVFGVGPDVPAVWRFALAQGGFLPDDPARSARSFAVLGSRLREELFGSANPLGRFVRVGGERFRVIGVMQSKGQLLGFDLDDAIYIPTAKALALFDRESLMEIDLLYSAGSDPEAVARRIKDLLVARHGREDFSITTQEQMLDVLGSVLNVITLAVAALGAISLLVGGVGIVTIMTIAVNERSAEVGLLRALGARRVQVLGVFLFEAVALAGVGGLLGLAVGAGGAQLAGFVFPALPVHTGWAYVVLAETLAVAIGLVAGVWPARRAASLNPVDALRTE